MKQYKYLNQPFSLPEKWSELTAAQLHKISPYLFHPVDDWKIRVRVLLMLAPVLSPKALKRAGQSAAEMLVRSLEWIWTTTMDACPITSFTFEGVEYFLPEPGFHSLVGIEYVSASHHFKAFARDRPTAGALDHLIAILCRPAKKGLDETDPEWDGDVREKFNSKICERRAAQFAKLPFGTKQLVLQFFIGSERGFHQQYQELYSAPQGGKGRSNSFGLLGILDAVAQEGIFGTFDQVCFTPVHTLYFHLLKAKRDQAPE